MNKENILTLLNLLNVKKIRETNGWIMGSCIFKKDHPKGTDNKPSFGISISNPSYFHCFTCNKKGLLYEIQPLLRKYELDITGDIYNFIVTHESFDFSLIEHDTPKTAGIVPYYEYSKYSVLDRKVLNIPVEISKKWDLRYDGEYVFIPIFDKFQRLIEVKIRSINDRKFMLYPNENFYPNLMRIDGCGAKSAGIWYGIHKSIDKDYIFLVEGERDALLLNSIGINNVLASMGAGLSSQQINSLITINKTFILFFDNDVAGEKAKNKIIKFLKSTHELYHVTNYFGCKDPAEAVEKNKIKEVIKSIDKISEEIILL